MIPAVAGNIFMKWRKHRTITWGGKDHAEDNKPDTPNGP